MILSPVRVEVARYVTGSAIWAPSVHNTQPWWFAVDDTEIELHADIRRQLRVADPDGREMLMSCGAALFTAKLALRALGFVPETRVLPDPDDPCLIARLRWRRQRTADFGEVVGGLSERDATYDGASLIIAYSHCIAHGIEMRDGLGQQYRAVASGYWPLIRYDPVLRAVGRNPFLLDSPRPRIKLADYTSKELRYRALATTDPAEAERLAELGQETVGQRWDTYEEMANRGPALYPADARKGRTEGD